MEIALTKVTDGVLVPVDEQSKEFIAKIKTGNTISANFKNKRNAKFHRKYFALLNYAYSHWEPEELQDSAWRGVIAHKSFDRFRKDIAILSGFYDATYRIDGSVRIEAKSIAFGKMSEENFEELYSNTIDVILDKVLTTYTQQQLNEVIDEVLRFA